VPDAADPNAVRFLAIKRSYLPWHGGAPGIIVVLPKATVTGTVGAVTPDSTNPAIGTFALTVTTDAGIFCDGDGRPLSGEIKVVVTTSTVFADGLQFSSALEGQNVTVEGMVTANIRLANLKGDGEGPIEIHLVATTVKSAASGPALP
jgi:hypothetical protein